MPNATSNENITDMIFLYIQEGRPKTQSIFIIADTYTAPLSLFLFHLFFILDNLITDFFSLIKDSNLKTCLCTTYHVHGVT
jgi:hypothetical protein